MSGDRTGLETRKLLVDNVLRREKKRVLSRRGFLSGSLFLRELFRDLRVYSRRRE